MQWFSLVPDKKPGIWFLLLFERELVALGKSLTIASPT